MNARRPPEPDIEMIRRTLGTITRPGSVVELRALRTRRGVVTGYFNDPDAMSKSAAALSGKAQGVYFTTNPVRSDLLARAVNRVVPYPKHTTADEDVLRLCWFLIDFDPVRPAGISSTDAEHEAALERARQCREWLRLQGWPQPLFADSGNGGHLLYNLDLPNDGANCELIRRSLEALGFQFTDSVVGVDPSTHNPARLCKVYGTLTAKGDHTPGRPHRLSRILEVPPDFRPVPIKLLQALARRVPRTEPRTEAHQRREKNNGFDLQRWIDLHKLDIDGPTNWKGGKRWRFRVCPWNGEHKDRAAYIVQLPSRAIAAGCLHESCADKDWHALRDLVEPGWRNHSAQYREAERAERKFAFRTAAQIAAETPANPDWLVEGYALAGGITELAGKIKSAGKTTFVTHLVRAVLDGKLFLGRPSTQSPVVYLTEQPKGSFRQALKRANLLDRHDLFVLFWHEVMGTPWTDVAHAAIEECKQWRCRLLVVDTGPQFIQLQGDAENNSGDALKAMQPLQGAAAAGLGVIVVRHERKSGGDVGDAGRGSSAFGGAVDIVLSIRRAEGNHRPTIRVIHGLSRFDETPDELVIDLTPAGYVSLGKTQAVEAQEAEASILSAAPTQESDAIKLDDLLEAAGEKKRTTAQRAVKKLLSKGQLARAGEGKRGNPYRYWGPKIDSAQTTPPTGQNETDQVPAPSGMGVMEI